MVKKFNVKLILKYIAIFFVCLICANANFYELSPFLYSFFFACLYVGLDEKLLGLFTLGSAVIVNPNLESFWIALSVVGIGLVLVYLHRFIKKKISLVVNIAVFLLSNTVYIVYNYLNYLNCMYYCLLGVIALLVFTIVLQVMELRKNCFKLTLDESVCFLFFIAVLGLGLANLNIGAFELYRLILMFVILFCVAINNPTLTYSITLSFSFGVAIYSNSLIVVAEFMIIALITSIFRMPNKFKIVITAICGELILQFGFLKSGLLFSVLPIILACLLFLLLPNKIVNSISDLIYVKSSEVTSRNLINTTRHNIKKRMCELSNVFLEMQKLHYQMVKKELTKQELVDMLMREISVASCRNCLEKTRCTRSIGTDNKSYLESIVETAVTKGKITLLDLPDGLTNRCVKVNELVTLINRLCEEYRQYKSMMTDVNNVKILLSDQMGAVSKLLLNLGDEIDANVRFDVARENKIISKLLSLNIQCKEVLLYTEKNQDLSAVLLIKADNTINPTIEKVVGEVLKTKMQITKISPYEEGSYNTVTLRKKERFDCVFGLASCNKAGNEQSGDCHSVIRLNNNKFLIALCDGMGSGKDANKMSAMTLGLIENFYKAGFDNDVILESVNKLLAVNNQESYSTLDVCLIDLEKEIADFIKIGSPFGLIKRNTNVEVVDGGALPIGVLNKIEPKTFKTSVSTNDLIILATDGIIDAFKSQDNLVEFVSKLASKNPQSIADTILTEALAISQMSAKDDMTILVARTYLKN